MKMDQELGVALAAVRQAARLCEAVGEDSALGPVRKRDTTPVTVADFGSQALICRALSEAFPDDPVVAEESSESLTSGSSSALLPAVVDRVRVYVPGAAEGDVLDWIARGARSDGADRYWALDPIDGTKGYIRGAQYAVALALVEEGRAVLSVVACPRLEIDGQRGIVAWARRGNGARIAGLDDAGPGNALSVLTGNPDGQVRYAESVERGHSAPGVAAGVADRLEMTEPPIRLDGQAKYVVVAHGDAAFYLRMPRGSRQIEYVWDHAAGSLLVEEAGGRVSDVNGKALDCSHGARLVANRGVLATNGHVHRSVLEALHALSGGSPA